MVDISDKPVTTRTAQAECRVVLGAEAYDLVSQNTIKKGDVLTVAQLAGICGAKHTSLLIPLCHPVAVSYAGVDLTLESETHSVHITATVKTAGGTGVEMEALTAAAVAGLTVYDMCKAVTRNMVMTN
eukprot:UC1_evm1s1439